MKSRTSIVLMYLGMAIVVGIFPVLAGILIAIRSTSFYGITLAFVWAVIVAVAGAQSAVEEISK